MDWLDGPAEAAARRLLGCILERKLDDGGILRGRIVETEAYDQADPASHSFKRARNRSAAMFGPSGHAYVYFTYGMYHCVNVVTGPAGHGAGVLIRALEPLAGLAAMRRNRPNVPDKQLTNGPGKLCQALAIDRSLYGHDLSRPPLRLIEMAPLAEAAITQTVRVGIRQAVDVPWRFYVTGNQYVSKPAAT